MKIQIILLADQKNGIHPRDLPWKDEHEPWLGIIIDNQKNKLLHANYPEDKVEFLLQYLCKFFFPELQKNPEDYFQQKKYEDYKNLKQELKQLLAGEQGECLELEFNTELNHPLKIQKMKFDLANYFDLVKRSYQHA